jgi:hypothetical protein
MVCGALGRRAHAGDLNNACLSYVLVSCGQHAVTMLEGTTCRSVDLQEFLTWLPLFVVRTNGLIAGATLYGSMEPAKVDDTYFESCKARQCNRLDQSVHECIDAEFYKLWYMIHRRLYQRLTTTNV